MLRELYSEIYYLCGVSFEVVVLETDLVSVPFVAFGDLQESESTNKIIFDYALEQLGMNYDISEATFLCTGDMYGESYFGANGKRVEIRGSDGMPNYSLYNYNNKFYYVFGNHDLYINYPGRLHCNIINICGTKVTGFDGIQSSKTTYPGTNKNYNSEIKNKFIGADITVTHETPNIPNTEMNPKQIGNTTLYNEIIKSKPKISVFGHCKFNKPYITHNNILFINSESRFILLKPL